MADFLTLNLNTGRICIKLYFHKLYIKDHEIIQGLQNQFVMKTCYTDASSNTKLYLNHESKLKGKQRDHQSFISIFILSNLFFFLLLSSCVIVDEAGIKMSEEFSYGL